MDTEYAVETEDNVMPTKLITAIKSPITHFIVAIGTVIGIVTAAGYDLKEPANWGWILLVGFFVLWIEEVVKGIVYGKSDSEDRLVSSVHVVKSQEVLYKELYRDEESVVKGAEKFIYITGSRSRNKEYLDAVEEKLKSRADVKYIRVLIGTPTSSVLIDHLNEVMEICESQGGDDGVRRGQIGFYHLGQNLPERFVCCSEKKALITLPSFRTAFGYDTALVVEDEKVARSIGDLIETLVTTAEHRCTDTSALEELSNGWTTQNDGSGRSDAATASSTTG